MTTMGEKHRIYHSPRVKIEQLPKAHVTSQTVGNIQIQKERFLRHGKTPVFVIEGDTASVEALENKAHGQIRFQYLGEAEYILKRVRDQYGLGENYLDAIYGPRISQAQANNLLMDYINENYLRESLDVFWSNNMTCSARMVWRGLHNKCNRPESRRYSLWVNGTEENPYLRETGFICLLDHEIGTHFFRTFNDGLQPWFSDRQRFDLRSSASFEGECTEEGLACIHTALRAGEHYLWLAALVYYTVCKATEMTFQQLYDHLGKFLNSPEQRWKHVMRVKRGLVDPNDLGGYGKDQCYFEGAVNILRNLDNIDFTLLMSGKLCYDEVKRVKRVARLNSIRLPAFMRDMEKYRQQLKQMTVLNGLDFVHPQHEPSTMYLRRLEQRQAGMKSPPRKVRKRRKAHASVSKLSNASSEMSICSWGSRDTSTDGVLKPLAGSESNGSIPKFNMKSLLTSWLQHAKIAQDEEEDENRQTPTGGLAEKITASLMDKYQPESKPATPSEKHRKVVVHHIRGRAAAADSLHMPLCDDTLRGPELAYAATPSLGVMPKLTAQVTDLISSGTCRKPGVPSADRPTSAKTKKPEAASHHPISGCTDGCDITCVALPGPLQDKPKKLEVIHESVERLDERAVSRPSTQLSQKLSDVLLMPSQRPLSASCAQQSDRKGVGMFDQEFVKISEVVVRMPSVNVTEMKADEVKCSDNPSSGDAVRKAEENLKTSHTVDEKVEVPAHMGESTALDVSAAVDLSRNARIKRFGRFGGNSSKKAGITITRRPSTSNQHTKSDDIHTGRPSSSSSSRKTLADSMVKVSIEELLKKDTRAGRPLASDSTKKGQSVIKYKFSTGDLMKKVEVQAPSKCRTSCDLSRKSEVIHSHRLSKSSNKRASIRAKSTSSANQHTWSGVARRLFSCEPGKKSDKPQLSRSKSYPMKREEVQRVCRSSTGESIKKRKSKKVQTDEGQLSTNDYVKISEARKKPSQRESNVTLAERSRERSVSKPSDPDSGIASKEQSLQEPSTDGAVRSSRKLRRPLMSSKPQGVPDTEKTANGSSSFQGESNTTHLIHSRANWKESLSQFSVVDLKLSAAFSGNVSNFAAPIRRPKSQSTMQRPKSQEVTSITTLPPLKQAHSGTSGGEGDQRQGKEKKNVSGEAPQKYVQEICSKVNETLEILSTQLHRMNAKGNAHPKRDHKMLSEGVNVVHGLLTQSAPSGRKLESSPQDESSVSTESGGHCSSSISTCFADNSDMSSSHEKICIGSQDISTDRYQYFQSESTLTCKKESGEQSSLHLAS